MATTLTARRGNQRSRLERHLRVDSEHEQESATRAKLAARIAELAAQCVVTAEGVSEINRLQRIAAISEWCAEVSERLAEDRFGTGEEPDYMADVASVAWELTALSEGKWPPPMVIRIARRRVRDGRQFEVSTITVESSTSPCKRVSDFDLDIWPDNRRPDRVAMFRIDFAGWLGTLPEQYQQIVERLAEGFTVPETAAEVGVPCHAVRRARRDLRQTWKNYFDESE